MDKLDIFLGLTAITATALGGYYIAKKRKTLGTILLIVGVGAFSTLIMKS